MSAASEASAPCARSATDGSPRHALPPHRRVHPAPGHRGLHRERRGARPPYQHLRRGLMVLELFPRRQPRREVPDPMNGTRYIVKENPDGYATTRRPGDWIGWDVVDSTTGKVPPGHQFYDYQDEAQAQADR